MNTSSSHPTTAVERALEALKKDYTLVGKTHIRAWQAWLVIGVVAGLVAGIFFVANRSGEVEKTRASGVAEVALPPNVELDIPPYLPESLRHPQRIFSGRKLLIKNTLPFRTNTAFLSAPSTGQMALKNEKRGERDLIVEIPAGIPTGSYQLSYTLDGISQTFSLAIYGLIPQGAQIARTLSAPSDSAIVYRTKICGDDDYCFWEMVFGGHPKDPKKLFLASGGSHFIRSLNGGRTWAIERIDPPNGIADYPDQDMQYRGDPKIAVTPRGAFYFSGLYSQPIGEQIKTGGILYNGKSVGRLAVNLFQEIDPKSEVGVFADRPEILVDSNSSTIYIAASAWFEDFGERRPGLFISRDGGKTFSKKDLGRFGSTHSMTLGTDGTLYAVRPDGYCSYSPGEPVVCYPHHMLRFRSFDPIEFDTLFLPARASAEPRMFVSSNRAWQVYTGPEIVADTSLQSPHRGRLYVVWAQAERNIQDSEFEYGAYGFNYNVFASYSDNRGETWSQPVKVNDDRGTGDQFFPSVRMDDRGRLHVAFVDHRDNQDSAVFDVYYAYSADGATFSKNIRITDTPTQNNASASRPIGDYLDMVMPYRDRVYVAYPCGSKQEGDVLRPAAACMVQLDIRHRKVGGADVENETSADGVSDE